MGKDIESIKVCSFEEEPGIGLQFDKNLSPEKKKELMEQIERDCERHGITLVRGDELTR